ncbi:MAG: hypothetical protein HZA15_12665 [Nitrospirae bacterium]|nr:hypothetical protein [Nitrospirota bacterium]
MEDRYRVVFEGKFKSDVSQSEIRNRLLVIYQGKQSSVDIFFSARRIVIGKDLSYQNAKKRLTQFEEAGLHCILIKEVPEPLKEGPAAALQEAAAKTVSSQQPASALFGVSDPGVNYDVSLRVIVAEAWGLIAGVKAEICGAAILTGLIYGIFFMTGYVIPLFMGEAGRNLYVAYGLLYGFGAISYPLTAGLIMMGVKRAAKDNVSVSMIFRSINKGILLLSLFLTVVGYALFALFYSLGADHFLAGSGEILFFPVFALCVPLIEEKGMGPFTALRTFFRMLFRYFPTIAALYLSLICINIFGSFLLIGFIWTIPLSFVASGVLFRNIMAAPALVEVEGKSMTGDRQRPVPTAPARQTAGPTLTGNEWQNAVAVVLLVMIIAGVSTRLWALKESRNIHPPVNVAANSRNVLVHSDKALFMLSPDGRTERRVELSTFGLRREPADLELLEDGTILIGDMDKKVILRCSPENGSCQTIGPPNNYRIEENFKFVADEKRNLLFVADTNNHRLIVQDLAGTAYRLLESPSNIAYPNDMGLDDSGGLWISNTLHERIMSFQVEGDAVKDSSRIISLDPFGAAVTALGQALQGSSDRQKVMADLQAAKKDMEAIKKDPLAVSLDMIHKRPLALAWGSDGNVWIAASDPVVTTAGIRVFDAAGKQVRSIHLDKGAVPEDIVRSGNRMVIADTGLFQIFAASIDSGNIFPFGDATLQGALTKSRDRLVFYREILKWSTWALLFLALATVVLLFVIFRGRRKSAERGVQR